MRATLAQVLAMIFLIVSSGGAQRPGGMASINTQTPVSPRASVSAVNFTKSQPYQVGTASWYGIDFDGKPTASGEPYNMYELTAAHPALPLGTFVKVTNLRNRKVVVVRINDRGPIVLGRVIDLSYGAAHVLQFGHRGLQRVRLDVVHPKAAQTELIAQVSRPLAY